MRSLILLLGVFLVATVADQCSPYSPEAIMFQLLSQGKTQPTGLFSAEYDRIRTARLSGDRVACISAWNDILSHLDKGEVTFGRIILYHGNIMGSGNVEVHVLHQPALIYSARTMDWLQSIHKGNTPLQLRVLVNDEDVEVEILDDSLNAPIEYTFRIRRLN